MISCLRRCASLQWRRAARHSQRTVMTIHCLSVALIVATIALVGNPPAVAQGAPPDRWVWQSYTPADGLPSADAVVLDVEDDGAVWVGYFAHGVSRYDGTWNHHSAADGLANDHVRAVRAIGDDVWVGHMGGMYSRLHDAEWLAGVVPNAVTVGPVTAIEPLAPHVTVLGLYPFGTLGDGGGVFELWEIPLEWRRPRLPPLPLRAISALSADADGALWIAGRNYVTVEGTLTGGVAHVEGGTVTLHTIAQGLPSNSVADVLWTRDGVWAATAEGLVRYVDGKWEVISAEFYFLDDLQALALDTDGSLWVGMSWGAAHRAHDGKWAFYTTADGLAGNDVRDIAVQPDGSVWFATDNGVTVRRSADGETSIENDPPLSFTLYLPITRR